MSTRMHTTLAVSTALLFPTAGLATELGRLAPAAFLTIAVGCCVTFAATTYALSRRPVPVRRPRRSTFVRPTGYLQ